MVSRRDETDDYGTGAQGGIASTEVGKWLRSIKTTLKVPRYPPLSYQHKIPIRLRSCNPYLILIKENYIPRFQPVKINLTHRINVDVPKWLGSLAESLSLYLDVFIVRHRSMVQDYIDPVYTYSIIGQEYQVILAAHYIEYIYKSIDLIVDVARLRHKAKSKHNRRKIRRQDKKGELIDTRIFSSNFRSKLINDINATINELLEIIKNDHEYAFNKGIDRQERISTYMIDKYTTKWKHVLFKNVG